MLGLTLTLRPASASFSASGESVSASARSSRMLGLRQLATWLRPPRTLRRDHPAVTGRVARLRRLLGIPGHRPIDSTLRSIRGRTAPTLVPLCFNAREGFVAGRAVASSSNRRHGIRRRVQWRLGGGGAWQLMTQRQGA